MPSGEVRLRIAPREFDSSIDEILDSNAHTSGTVGVFSEVCGMLGRSPEYLKEDLALVRDNQFRLGPDFFLT